MSNRNYYSVRTGKNPNARKFDLSFLKRLFRDLYFKYSEGGYFQEAFGYECVDLGNVPGSLGSDLEAQMFYKLRKPLMWPIYEKCLDYSEDDLFDVIEFVFDQISKPIDGNYHGYGGCGWHYHTFDKKVGQDEFRNEINYILVDYSTGFELSNNGEIFNLVDKGLENLINATLPTYDKENVEVHIELAINKFRRHRSTMDERRDAIRDLADVLEFLRPQVKQVLNTTDESDLFNIANNFGIRHHNSSQKNNYDKAIWFSWMFYYYLSTIHACLHLIRRAETNRNGS
jgi:hypothetical protein